MPYCTLQDLQDRFGADEIIRLADRDGDGVPDAVVVDTAIADADAKIDSYLTSHYTLPFAAAPAVIKPLACDITRYLLHDNKPSKTVVKRYTQSIDFLESIQRGETSLGAQTATGVNSPVFTPPVTEFDDVKLSGY